jgi:hypothetical protein
VISVAGPPFDGRSFTWFESYAHPFIGPFIASFITSREPG